MFIFINNKVSNFNYVILGDTLIEEIVEIGLVIAIVGRLVKTESGGDHVVEGVN